MTQKKRLIYTHVGLSSFVKKDIKILEDQFELKVYHFSLNSKKKLPIVFIRQFWWLLINLPKSHGSVTQFGGYQSYLPTLLSKIYRRKSILVLGGTDTVSFPSIGYGCFYNKYLRFFTEKSLKNASLLLPVSETLVEYNYTYTHQDFPKQGYLYHAPTTTTPFTTIYNGYDANKWEFSTVKETNSFLTIGADLGTSFGAKLKGIDLILEVANELPHCKFYIIGGQSIKAELPQNVIPVSNMPHDELPAFIANKQFYMQLSMSEGFPNALCEAMLCGCIPIVSNVGAMPSILATNGYILKEKSVAQLKAIIENAISNYSEEQALSARERIASNFTLKRRKEELNSTIEKHLNSN